MKWKQQPKCVLVLIKFGEPDLLPNIADTIRYLVDEHALTVFIEASGIFLGRDRRCA